jgi:transcriptional regulator GlxA family with amidase domain
MLTHANAASQGAPATRHSRVIAAFEELLEANRIWPLRLAEICAMTGVSDRTLRVCCHEHLGMGPIRYMWLRRMHLARRALMRADRTTANVTKIATHFGFCELGRFSVEYGALFGELPSASLRRPSDRLGGPIVTVDCTADSSKLGNRLAPNAGHAVAALPPQSA